MSKPITYIYYFIPGDGDTEEYPNVFPIQKSTKSISVQDIQRYFPLPGTYFFRFKQDYGKTYVWLDVNDPTEQAPTYNGRIVCKVSRLSFEDNRLNDTSADIGSSTPVGTQNTATPSPIPEQTIQHPEPQKSQPREVAKQSKADSGTDSGDLLGIGSSSAASRRQTSTRNNPEGGNDLVDLDSGSKRPTNHMAEFEDLDFAEKTSPQRNTGRQNNSGKGRDNKEDLDNILSEWA